MAPVDIAVIGLGLIGGSMVRALAGVGHRALGYDSDPGTRAVARNAAATAPAGGRWEVAQSLRSAVTGRDLVVVAVPLPAVARVFEEISAAGHLGLVTDVTSVKGPVHRLAERSLAAAGFVGGHPMAGRETSGFASGDARLFRGCAWVLSLEPDRTRMDDWLALARLVLDLGARVVPATPADHDRAAAVISHLPHVLAAALTGLAAGDPLALTLGAGSFRDATRVAASPADLQAAMCAGNADLVRAALEDLAGVLDGARAALDKPDVMAALRSWFAPPSAVRRNWPPPASDEATLPARPDVLIRLGRAGGWVTGVARDGRTVTAARPVP